MKTKFILIVLMCLLVSCSPEPAITTYAPPQESPLKITFQYPDNWEMYLEPTETQVEEMVVVDPQGTENRDRGMISFRVVETNTPMKDMQAEIEYFRTATQELAFITMMADEQIEINNNLAQRFVRQVQPFAREGQTQERYSETLFVLSRNRYYIINFSIPESEVDGRFHQEFKALVESIQFLP